MNNLNIFRPQKLNEFIGNVKICEILSIYLFSAKKRKASLDHVLLYGQPGVGKTSLANIISNELESHLISVSAPILKYPSDLINLIANINSGDVLFIDEFHRLNKEIEEILYSVMEDFQISINYKNNENNKILKLEVPPFTLIGATTIIGKISLPLRERFPIILKLETYSVDELSKIISNNATKLKINIDKDGIKEIAKRSRCTPRLANNYLKRIYDFSLYYKKEKIDRNFIIDRFCDLGIDDLGLTNTDYKIIEIMFNDFKNNPVSFDSIALKLNDDPESLISFNEQYLLSINIIERTRRGRKLTDFGKNIYLNRIKKR